MAQHEKVNLIAFLNFANNHFWHFTCFCYCFISICFCHPLPTAPPSQTKHGKFNILFIWYIFMMAYVPMPIIHKLRWHFRNWTKEFAGNILKQMYICVCVYARVKTTAHIKNMAFHFIQFSFSNQNEMQKSKPFHGEYIFSMPKTHTICGSWLFKWHFHVAMSLVWWFFNFSTSKMVTLLHRHCRCWCCWCFFLRFLLLLFPFSVFTFSTCLFFENVSFQF